MPVTVFAKSIDPSVRAAREAVARRVLSEFGNQLPDLNLLAFFDDEDWYAFRQELGLTNRGFYFAIKKWPPDMPPYVEARIFDDPAKFARKRTFDHLIYVHGTTCADNVGLAMTFAHELQHFHQHGFNRNLWAANSLIQQLPQEIFNIAELNWPYDVPTEREARIVAKRVAEKLFGTDAVKQYIDRRIGENITFQDAADWRFVRELDSGILYDLAMGTRQIFQRLAPYRLNLESYLHSQLQNPDFRDLSLSDYFEPAKAAADTCTTSASL